MPQAFMISTQRSPNLPAEHTSTSSPGEKKFWVAASSAARSGSDQHQHVIRCVQYLFQVRQNLLVKIAEIFGPMMDVGTHHGV